MAAAATTIGGGAGEVLDRRSGVAVMEGQQDWEYEEYDEVEGDVEMDGGTEEEEEAGDPAAKEKVRDVV